MGIRVLRILRDDSIEIHDRQIIWHDLIDADPPAPLAVARGQQDATAVDPLHCDPQVVAQGDESPLVMEWRVPLFQDDQQSRREPTFRFGPGRWLSIPWLSEGHHSPIQHQEQCDQTRAELLGAEPQVNLGTIRPSRYGMCVASPWGWRTPRTPTTDIRHPANPSQQGVRTGPSTRSP